MTTEVINTNTGKLDINIVETMEPKVPHKNTHNESKMIGKDVSSQ